MEFKVGDRIIEMTTGVEGIIIASKTQAYDGKGSGPFHQNITPNGDNDFVIVEADKEGFNSFMHVKKEQLQKLK